MMLAAVAPPRPSSPKLFAPPSMMMQGGSASLRNQTTRHNSNNNNNTNNNTNNNNNSDHGNSQLPRITSEPQELKLLHPPSSKAAPKTEDASYLMSFSATVSEDVDDFVLLAQSPSSATQCLYTTTYCGALDCWDGSASQTINSTTTVSRYEQIQNGMISQDDDDEDDIFTAATPVIDAPPPPQRLSSSPRAAAPAPPPPPPPNSSCLASPALRSTALHDDPILQSRLSAGDLSDAESKRVRFTKDVNVVEFASIPAHQMAELFWSEYEGYELRHERRELLYKFKQHISYSPLVPWTEETDSIRGLEDHYADMVGRTNSYYIRKRHEDLILREYRRCRYSPNGPDRLASIAEMSSEEDRDRALEMAQLDLGMAKDEGQEGATTSPVSAPLFTSGEAFLHTLMVRLRDYT